MAEGDRKMFAPLWRGTAVSPEGKLLALLKIHAAGATATGLANQLMAAGLAVGPRDPIARRVRELLAELEQAGHVERIPDGRYRATRGRPGRPDAP